jgi:hypothetical protein
MHDRRFQLTGKLDQRTVRAAQPLPHIRAMLLE